MGKEMSKTAASAADPAVLEAMLRAREMRWQRRMELSENTPALISVTLCVPLPFRLCPEGKTLLRDSAERLIKELRRAGAYPEGLCGEAEWTDGADGPCVFISCGTDAQAVKRLCVEAEETLLLGRFLDVDVTAQGGQPIGRAELGLPPRRCFLCGRPAAECVASSRHDPAEIAAFIKREWSRKAGPG